MLDHLMHVSLLPRSYSAKLTPVLDPKSPPVVPVCAGCCPNDVLLWPIFPNRPPDCCCCCCCWVVWKRTSILLQEESLTPLPPKRPPLGCAGVVPNVLVPVEPNKPPPGKETHFLSWWFLELMQNTNKHEEVIYDVFHSATSSPFRDLLPVAGLEAKRDEVPAVALVEEPKIEPVVVPDVAPKFDAPERKDHFRFRISLSIIYILTMIISRFHIPFKKLKLRY